MTVAAAPQTAIARAFSSRIRAIAISAILVTGGAALVAAPVGAAGDAGIAATVQSGQAH